MKIIKVYFIILLFFLIFIFSYFILKNINFKQEEKISLDNENILKSENVFNEENILRNEKYNYEINLKYPFELKNNDKFLSLKDGNCVLNLVSFINEEDVSACDWVKKECLDLDCDTYSCENFKNNWYKVRYFGDFMGSSDYELILQNNNYVYSANVECFNPDLDNYENPLFLDLILNFKIKNND
jgi:hypothetical protein